MIIEKYIGYRPVSERTAKLEELLFTPKIYFKYLTSVAIHLRYCISSNKNTLRFLHAALYVLNNPQISETYNIIGLIRLAYKCKLVFILGLPNVVSFVSLNDVLIDHLKNNYLTKIKISTY